jgi:glutamyl-tRNA reductase
LIGSTSPDANVVRVQARDLSERDEALQPADVVVCATSARSPVFEEL